THTLSLSFPLLLISHPHQIASWILPEFSSRKRLLIGPSYLTSFCFASTCPPRQAPFSYATHTTPSYLTGSPRKGT
ncbi:hypothetical protein EDB84DRAFT_1524456, partial [Lactarius hengduanensis]